MEQESEQESILYSQNQGIATLALNRPEKRNAFNDQAIELLMQHLKESAANDSIQILVLRGNGEHFCAGADIQWMQKAAKYSIEENKRDAVKLAELMQLLYEFPKPTITLVQGSVYGGGIGLVACSDIVLASNTTQFCFSEVKLGLVPAVVGPYVVQAIGQRAALRYMLTAEVFSAERALELNLVHEVVNNREIDTHLSKLLVKLNENGPNALQRTKTMMHHFTASNPPTRFKEYTTDLISHLRASEEAKEGFSAFLEKRNPKWQEGAFD